MKILIEFHENASTPLIDCVSHAATHDYKQHFRVGDGRNGSGRQMLIHCLSWRENCQIRKINSVEKWFQDNDKWEQRRLSKISRLVRAWFFFHSFSLWIAWCLAHTHTHFFYETTLNGSNNNKNNNTSNDVGVHVNVARSLSLPILISKIITALKQKIPTMMMREIWRKGTANNSKWLAQWTIYHFNGFRNAHASNINAGSEKEMFKFIFIIDWQCTRTHSLTHTLTHSSTKWISDSIFIEFFHQFWINTPDVRGLTATISRIISSTTVNVRL